MDFKKYFLKISKQAIFFFLFLLILLGGFFVIENKSKNEIIFEKSNLIIDQEKTIEEPSGAVFNPLTKTIYVVSDQGSIFEISLKGEILREKLLGRLDLEGVAYDYLNNRIFVVVEKKDLIMEIGVDDFEIKKTFEIDRYFEGKEVLNPDKEGIEGLTIIPEKQEIYLVNQGFSLKEKYKNDAPAIIKIKLPQDDYHSVNKLWIENYYSTVVDDLSEIVYFGKEKNLVVLSDSNNLLMKYNLEGKLLSQIVLEDLGKEGLAIDDENNFYLFREDGKIVNFTLDNK